MRKLVTILAVLVLLGAIVALQARPTLTCTLEGATIAACAFSCQQQIEDQCDMYDTGCGTADQAVALGLAIAECESRGECDPQHGPCPL